MELPSLALPALPSLTALRHRDFRAIWLGSLVSNIGTWMETVATGIYVTETTGSAGWTGAVAAAMFLPTAVFAPVGGALADRFDRRRYIASLIVVQTLLAGTLAGLAFTHHLSLGAVMFIAFAAGCTGALVNPAFNALLADVVPPEDLLSALSLSSAQYNLGRFIGPTLAAAVIAAGSVGWAFACNTLSFAAVLYAAYAVRVAPPDPGPRTSLLVNIREGMRSVRGDPAIRFALGTVAGVAFLVAPFIGLLPAFAIRVLGEGPATTSLLVSFQGAGAVLAALMLGSITERLGPERTFVRTSIGVGLVATGFWLAPGYGIAAGLLFFLGGFYLSMLTSASTAIQSRTTRALRGRVYALYAMVLNGSYGLGLIALGALGDLVGLRVVMASCAALFAIGMITLCTRRPDLFALLGHPPVRSDPHVPIAPRAGTIRAA